MTEKDEMPDSYRSFDQTAATIPIVNENKPAKTAYAAALDLLTYGNPGVLLERHHQKAILKELERLHVLENHILVLVHGIEDFVSVLKEQIDEYEAVGQLTFAAHTRGKIEGIQYLYRQLAEDRDLSKKENSDD